MLFKTREVEDQVADGSPSSFECLIKELDSLSHTLNSNYEHIKVAPTDFFGLKIPKGMLLMGKEQSTGTSKGQATCMLFGLIKLSGSHRIQEAL